MSHLLDPLNFPLHGSRLIEASAGTGKTWTIAALYVRLVLGHGDESAASRPLSPEEILVVTFTRAATEELRDRIRARLTEAAAVFRGGHGDGFLTALRESYELSSWPLQAWRLELAAASMDQAAISTIHGWCQRMLRQHAFESGTPFGTELEGDDTALREQVARDYWRTFLQPQSAGVLALVQAVVADPDDLAVQIARLPADPALAADDGFLAGCSSWRSRCDELEGEARRACEAEVAAIREWFIEAMAQGWLNKASHRPDKLTEQLDRLAQWATSGAPCDVEVLRRLAPANLRLTKGAGPLPDTAGLRALARLVDHHETPPPLREPLLRHAAAWCAQRLALQKQRLGSMSYDDLLVRLHAALHGDGGDSLAAIIRRQFPVALIDEFQDTDPTQYAIFRRLYGRPYECGAGEQDAGAHETALLMIGDPKQAIYAFRGADIYAYLQARRDTEGRHYTLGTNFRSTEGLVAAVNALFGRGQRWPDGAFLLRDEIPFVSVAAAGRKERLLIDGSEQRALTLWVPADNEPHSKGRYHETMSAACANAIAALLNGAEAGTNRILQPDGTDELLGAADIAVLVRTGTEAALVRDALAARNLKSVYLSDRDSVFASAQAVDVLCWLEAAAAPDRIDLLRRALATATLALPLAALDRYAREESAAETLIAQFHRYHALWRERGVLPMLRALLDDFDVAARWLGAPAGERVLTNLLQLAELLQRAGSLLEGHHALIRELCDRIDAARRGDPNEEHVLRLESDADLIRVVTMHKSKGLEYPLVFIPFACGARPAKATDTTLRYHTDDGALTVTVTPTDEEVARADRERLAEDLRLLYVALTRARHACWVGLAPLGKQNKTEYRCDLRATAMGYLLAGGEEIDPPRLRQLLTEVATGCDAMQLTLAPVDDVSFQNTGPAVTPALAARRAERPPTRPWWIGSYSGLVAGLSESGLPEAEASGRESTLRELRRESPTDAKALVLDDPDAGIHRFPAGPGPGSFLHAILEWAAEVGFATAASETALRRDQLARYCNRRGWSAWVPVLDRWLQALLTTPLPLASGSVALANLTAAQYRAEMEFLIEAKSVSIARLDQVVTAAILPGLPRPRLERHQLNGMLKGYIDLLLEHEGRYFVVDYKSNWLGASARAYNQDAMNAAILEHRYDLQYTLYTLALHRLLRARLPGYDYDRHVGSALYLFLRGLGMGVSGDIGLHRLRPPRALIETLDGMFQHEERAANV